MTLVLFLQVEIMQDVRRVRNEKDEKPEKGWVSQTTDMK